MMNEPITVIDKLCLVLIIYEKNDTICVSNEKGVIWNAALTRLHIFLNLKNFIEKQNAEFFISSP
jgi:hypothetical protein